MNSGWTPTKIVLDGFFDLLACRKCKKIPERPTRYINCGHFFCDTCVYGQLTCFRCKIPVKANELQPDRTVAGLLEYCQIIRNVISEIHPEDSKSLANIVNQFAAAQKEVVPETDTESEDEIVESTPPGLRSRLKSSQSNLSGYADHSQIINSHREKEFGQETAGFVSPTQFSPRRRKKNANPENAGCITQPNKSYGEKESEQETAGFVSPTQFSPCLRKINVAPEIAEYVDRTRVNKSNEEKSFEPETVGFVDPTQFSPRNLKKNLQQEIGQFVDPKKPNESFVTKDFEPETAGFVDPTQFSPCQRKLNLGPKPNEHVDRSNKNRGKIIHKKIYSQPESPIQTARLNETLLPETLGYVDQTPPSHRKKRILAQSREYLARTVQTQQHLKTSMLESYVDPTQINLRGRKLDLQPEKVDRVEPEKNKSHEETDRRMESAALIESTSLNKQDSNISLEPETVGYVDPTQSQLCKKNNAENDELQGAKKIHYDPNRMRNVARPIENWNDKMEIEESAVKIPSSHRANEDSSIPLESVEMEEIASSINLDKIRTLENTSNYQDLPMEIEEIDDAAMIEKPCVKVKISNIDASIISHNTPEKSNEILEKQEETPLNKLRRIKGMAALSRISRIRRNSAVSSVTEGSPPLIAETRKNEPEKQFDIENKSPDAANFCKDVEKILGKSPPKLRRRTRNSTIDEETEKSEILGVEKSKSTEMNPTKSLVELKKKKMNASARLSKTTEKEAEEEEMNPTKSPVELKKKKKIDASARLSKNTEKEALKKLKSVENLENENKTPTRKCREKFGNFKSVSPIRKSVPKNINKRNAKGETPLHTACVKGQKDFVKDLIEAGANPNTKDNANWTPLQEAVNLGHREICEMLLQAGASTNTPAMENRTALHDAASGNKLEEATLLLRFNANRNVYDKFGKRPIDYAVSDEMRALLADENTVENIIEDIACLNSTLDQSIIVPNAKVVVLPSNLSNKNRKLLAQLASKLKVEVATTFRPSVTHVIVEANERNVTKLTYDVMLAILQGKWILNSQWITISADLNDISEIDLELFEVRGAPNSETPTRARFNEEQQNPRLFNNCFFYFALGAHGAWNYEKFEFTKENLTILVHAGQGEILNREPDPEDVRDYKLTPFHVSAKPIHPLHRCSHYIIYMPGKDEPRVKYSMPHIKTLPVGWFLECIEKFALVDPSLMGIS